MGCGASAARATSQSEDAKTQSTDTPEKASTAEVQKLETDPGSEQQPATAPDEPKADSSSEQQLAAVLHDPQVTAESRDAQQGALRRRLISLGQSMSIEVAPADVNFGIAGAAEAGGKGPKKLLQLQAEFAEQGKPPVLREGTPVYVNMVKTTMEHFGDVKDASQALAAAGFCPYPHLPASRFASEDDCRSTVTALAGVGVSQVLVIGGNDLQEQLAANSCAYATGACGLLSSELATLQGAGVKSVAIAGHPDGHPGLSWDAAKTDAVLRDKIKPLLEAGLNVVVTTQFCFDARKLVHWLQVSRESLLALREEVLSSGKPCGMVSFCIGVPGPTPMKKLERIAKICEVPSLFVSSAFDLMDSNQDGVIAWEDFQKAVQTLGLSRRSTTKLASFYEEHADENGLMRPDGFSNMLLEDAISRRISFGAVSDKENIEGKQVSGPSAFVQENGGKAGKNGDGKTETSRIVWPDELILTLAAYCERYKVQVGEVMLHFFPFGGLARTFELLSELQAGTWPRLSEDSVPTIS